MWKQPADVRIKSFSQGHIDCQVQVGGKKVRVTGFYGNPMVEQRRFSWSLLKWLKDDVGMVSSPWLVAGDFNEIATDSEKKGGRNRPLRQMQEFRETMLYCCLQELERPNKEFTSCNKREGNMIFERLDRVVVNKEWHGLFPNTTARVLYFFGSDHRPIVCKLEEEEKHFICYGKGRFHFEDK